jgi:hypothetical protein
VLALAVVLVAAAALLGPRNGDDTAKVTSRLLAPLSGVPQDGITLGKLTAPDRLAVYADVTSDDFGAFEQNVLPSLVRRYVASGRMAIQIRTWPSQAPAGATIGDPLLAARGAQAAGLQNRLWQYLAVLWARYPGYFDSGVMTDVFAHTPGLNAQAATQVVSTRRVAAAVDRAVSRGRRLGLRQLPGFVFDLAGGRPPRLLKPPRMTAAAFLATLDAARR